MANAEYRLQFADHVQRHFFNGGVMTPTEAAASYQQLMDEIDRAIVGESARWGDNRVSSPYTRDSWLGVQNDLLNNFFPLRTNIVLGQLRSRGLFPSTSFDAPSFSQHGGIISPGSTLAITNNEGTGTVYYTTDGSDPRLAGGGINPDAMAYSSPFELPNPAQTINARLLRSGTWSAVLSAEFQQSALSSEQEFLQVTEINYNPIGPTSAEQSAGFTDGDQFEFIELLNTSATETLELDGLNFTDGIEATFAGTTPLAPGERALVVSDLAAFTERYGAAVVNSAAAVIEYTSGQLSNSGETLELSGPGGEIIFNLDYNDNDPWTPDC